jgi:glycerol-3-phosphate dehydrogenase
MVAREASRRARLMICVGATIPLMLSFSAQTRAANLARMAEDRFDVLVIGGGITGVGIALDAAARAFSVALVEKDDFASGTSGRSSRLIHGGFRYLEHREFGLVHEALRERKILLRLAPHLVRPIPMYMLADSLPSRALYRLGLAGYDLLAAGRNVGLHRSVRAEQVREAVPGLGGRSRGFRYFECQTDDARLTIEVARTAQACGAVLANHARVEGLLGGARVEGAAVVDEMTGQRFEIRARATVNAGGVWADRVRGLAVAGRERLVPSKGVHLVFAPGTVRTKVGVVAPSAAHDGRFVFLIPWEDRVYAGTTDTAYSGDLEDPAVDDSDRDYILSAVAQYFPTVTDCDVVASWAGLRPLLNPDHASADVRTRDLSRRHAVFEDPPGLFTITGGKLTTYRAMAEDLVDRIADAFRVAGQCRTRDIALGLHGSSGEALRLATAEVARLRLSPHVGARLVQRYGDDWREAVHMISEDQSLGEPIVDSLPVLNVELELARSREMAITDEDVFVRRTRLTAFDTSVKPSAG